MELIVIAVLVLLCGLGFSATLMLAALRSTESNPDVIDIFDHRHHRPRRYRPPHGTSSRRDAA